MPDDLAGFSSHLTHESRMGTPVAKGHRNRNQRVVCDSQERHIEISLTNHDIERRSDHPAQQPVSQPTGRTPHHQDSTVIRTTHLVRLQGLDAESSASCDGLAKLGTVDELHRESPVHP